MTACVGDENFPYLAVWGFCEISGMATEIGDLTAEN